MLLVVAILEVAINRIAVPMLRVPVGQQPPPWHTSLDYIGLFLLYFSGSLATLVIVARCIAMVSEQRRIADRIAQGTLLIAAVITAAPLLTSLPEWTSSLLAVVFAAAVVAMIATVFGDKRDLGVQVGLPIIAIPLLLHSATVVGAELGWTENMFDGPGQTLVKWGVLGLCLAALATPYCFAPRPFARSVTRPVPIVIAMAVAGVGAVVTSLFYTQVARAAMLAIGVEMNAGQADQRRALYLLGLATLAWTISSCVIAASEARRAIGAGLVLVVLGGYAFTWPHHYLLPLLGFSLLVGAARTVRDEELEALPYSSDAPPVADATWSAYITAITRGLRDSLGEAHSLTTRGEGGLASTVIVCEANGLPVRTRIERIGGRVLALDIVVGRDIDEVRGSTITIWAIPERGSGANPPGPPAAPLVRTGDLEFDSRFKVRGSAAVFAKLFDAELRAKAITTLDGWFAAWERQAVRYRVYPGRGAPLDHPLPLSDLALGRVPPNAERLVTVIELIVELGTRAVDPVPAVPAAPEPTELEAS